MNITLNPDHTAARIEINDDLSAQALDTLIRQLALTRAEMHPPVPATNKTLEQEVLIEDMPALNIAARMGGGFRLWLRHRGLNWLGYQIDDATAASLSRFVLKHTGEASGVDLISTQQSNKH